MKELDDILLTELQRGHATVKEIVIRLQPASVCDWKDCAGAAFLYATDIGRTSPDR
jgi:hypothetical protein